MRDRPVIRYCGACAMLGGLLWSLTAIVHSAEPEECLSAECSPKPMQETADFVDIMTASSAVLVLTGLAGLVVLASRERRFGRTGGVGVVIATTGFAVLLLTAVLPAVFSGGYPPWLHLAVIPGVLAVAAGFILIGVAGADGSDVRVRDTAVLLDDDNNAWPTWNAYAEELACDTRARAVHISDGGITGPAFFDHVRRSRRPIINSPKGQTTPLPPDLVRRAMVDPKPYWTWSLVWRRSEVRAAVPDVVEVLTRGVEDLGINAPDAWLPDGDPHKQ